MKPLLAALFYLLSTAVLGIGLWLAIDKGSLWLLLVGIGAYLALFTRYGCQSH